MGTHPIFESDFDCLTENVSFVEETADRREEHDDRVHCDGHFRRY